MNKSEIKQIEIKDNQVTRLSTCCFAEVDCGGGGYEGEYIHPVYDYCKECKQKDPEYITLKPEGFKPIKMPF